MGTERARNAIVHATGHADQRGAARGPRQVNDDWFDVIAALLDGGVRFLVVGAHALAVHGVPRGTQDLDVWIDPDPSNAERAWSALTAFGAPLSALGVTPADFQQLDTVVQLGVPPNRIDVLTSLSGLDSFDIAWTDRVTSAVRGRETPFLGRESLLRTKRASGRLKDLADVEALGELE